MCWNYGRGKGRLLQGSDIWDLAGDLERIREQVSRPGVERTPEKEVQHGWSVAGEQEWVESLGDTPRATTRIDSFITLHSLLGRPFLPGLPVFRFPPVYFICHFLTISKLHGLSQWFIIFHASVGSELGQGSAWWFFDSMWHWLMSLPQLFSWLPGLGWKVQEASLTFLGPRWFLYLTSPHSAV